MSMMADALSIAIDRAYPGLSDDARDRVQEAFLAGDLDYDDTRRIEVEFERIDHLDVRPYSPSCPACVQTVADRRAAGRALPEGVR